MLYAAAYQKNFFQPQGGAGLSAGFGRPIALAGAGARVRCGSRFFADGAHPSGETLFFGGSVHFSLSHCRGMVCCAVSRSPVGGRCGRPPASAPAPCRPCLYPGRAYLALLPAGPGCRVFVPVDAERKCHEALRPRDCLRVSSGLPLPLGSRGLYSGNRTCTCSSLLCREGMCFPPLPGRSTSGWSRWKTWADPYIFLHSLS